MINMTKTKGTKEWADSNGNFQQGCQCKNLTERDGLYYCKNRKEYISPISQCQYCNKKTSQPTLEDFF